MKKYPLPRLVPPMFIRVLLVFVFIVLSGKGIFSEESSRLTPSISPARFTENLVMLHPEFFPLAKPIDYFVELPSFTHHKKGFRMPSIMGKGLMPVWELADFLEKNNPSIPLKKANTIARIYVEEARHEGVNPDVAFSQMCLETGFMRFGGDVHPDQYNFCGLGVARTGSKGLSFSNMRLGIRAHIQHLKAYASTQKMNHPIVDKRFQFVQRGSVKNIDDLSGRWASDRNYSSKIISLIKRLYQEK
ncbi:MAG: glucosaminidase domain-containing protein [Bacteroidales bacterium]|nr:glucosaminidase domain-containing protein [Bacteroidales bacterium]